MSTQWIDCGSYQVNGSLFHDTTAGQLVFNQGDCVVVDENDSVEKALSILGSRGFSSLPVRNKAGQFTGILNMGDIAAHMAGYKRGPGEDSASYDDGQRHRHLSKEKESSGLGGGLSVACKDILGLTWESRHLVIFDALDRIDAVIPKLCSGSHRALVQGKGWWQILSQWDLVVWMSRHAREFDDPNLASDRKQWIGSLANCTLGELGLSSTKPVVALPHTITAMEGFRQLAMNGVSAMPILDQYKELIGTLSTSDLRGLNAELIKALNMNVLDFLKVANTLQYPQVTATADTTLTELLLKFAARDVHRVWIMDRHKKLDGVCSISDILNMVGRCLACGPKSTITCGVDLGAMPSLAKAGTEAAFTKGAEGSIKGKGKSASCSECPPSGECVSCGSASQGGKIKACGCTQPCECAAAMKGAKGGEKGGEKGGVKMGAQWPTVEEGSVARDVPRGATFACGCIGECSCGQFTHKKH